MRRKGDYLPTELAMRVLVAVQDAYRRDKHFVMFDLAGNVCDELSISRATAYRHMRSAIDVLGISYDDDPVRDRARREKMGSGSVDARTYGWPNGAPGRPRKAA